ncbi:MAG: MerR family transcriptional regulator [Eubacteriales bacterium]|nr:MerR family transcriptional regulator [Eubacteriales bacterium]
MKKYLTISEFAGLRNVNINSIRYYEKQKVLLPAWIDPQTKYRYYSPEQLPVLDTITLCIKLGIPLKELKKYIDKNGKLDEKSILENGKKVLQERISEIQLGLEITQFNLNSMKQNQEYTDQKGIYTRQIEERFILQAPFCGDWNDLIQKEQAAMRLFHDAQAQNMAPVFPAGILIRCDTEPVSYSFFVQVLHPLEQNEQILCIPKSTFSCMQIELTTETNIEKVLHENFQIQNGQPAILSNMLLNKLHFNSRHSEIQVPIG